MKTIAKVLVMSAIVGAAVVAAPKQAKADDECLEVGWRDKAGEWTYYRAWLDAVDRDHLSLHYDYHHGQLELKVIPKEKEDGEHITVFKGRWFEGRDAQRTGKVRLILEEGHHTARGWYTYGDAEDAAHFDFKLRDCKR
jgi:hypothetical protein